MYRGDVIVKVAPATVSDSLLAEVVWMEEAPLVHVFSLVVLSKLYQYIVDVEYFALFVSVLCLGSVICGWFFYSLVEKPLDKYLKRILVRLDV